MSNQAAISNDKDPEYAYHVLRGALQKFHKNVSELDAGQFKQTILIADKTYKLESMVLSTPEARDVIVDEYRLDEAMKRVSDRYSDHEYFLHDLKINNLSEDVLRSALYRELIFDAVLDRVSANCLAVSDIDVEIFYQLHKKEFFKPEKRKARHILITINPDFPENDRESAYQRIAEISVKLKKSPSRFKALARAHSECPTAMDGGKLGEIERGTLYPELDTELFSMQAGEMSDIIETEMGFHVLFCEKINKSVAVPLAHARQRINQVLLDRNKKTCQKEWLRKIRNLAND